MPADRSGGAPRSDAAPDRPRTPAWAARGLASLPARPRVLAPGGLVTAAPTATRVKLHASSAFAARLGRPDDAALHRVHTALDFDAWRRNLDLLPRDLRDRYWDLVTSLRDGFDLHLPPLAPELLGGSRYFRDPNRLDDEGAERLDDHIVAEVQAGRYVGPYQPARLVALLGCFRTTKCSWVPKAPLLDGRPRWRLIQNGSSPYKGAPRSSEGRPARID
jgi:hypothetical protein